MSVLISVASWFNIFSFGDLDMWELTSSSFFVFVSVFFRGADKESPKSSSRFALFSKYCLFLLPTLSFVFCLVSVEGNRNQ